VQSRSKTLEQRIEQLERELAELKGENWVYTGPAGRLLHISPQAIHHKIKSQPKTYREGRCWKWNANRTRILVNVPNWRKANG
jgi:hypothetical protein